VLSGHQANSSPPYLVALLATLLSSLTYSAVLYLSDYSVVPQGPATALAEATKSLWHSWSLSPQYYHDVFESARKLSISSGAAVWQDTFALSADQRLLPKHSIFTVFAALPFYALFGTAGFWLCQQAFVLWLLYSVYQIAERIGGIPRPLTTVAVVLCGTPCLLYSFSLGYDLHVAALIVGGLHLILTRPLLGGFILGLSVFVRPAHIILAAPLCFAMTSAHADRRSHTYFSITGLSLSLLAFAILNYIWWGSAFLTAYHRIPHFIAGEVFLDKHPIGFDLATLATNWPDKLLGGSGLLWLNAALLALPWMLKRIRTHPERRFLIVCSASALLYALYIFSYPMWNISGPGNRFLFPSICIYVVALLSCSQNRRTACSECAS